MLTQKPSLPKWTVFEYNKEVNLLLQFKNTKTGKYIVYFCTTTIFFSQWLFYIFLYKIFMGITYCRFHCLWHSYSDAADTLENVHHLLHLQTFSAVVDGNKSSASSIPISKSKSNINNTKYTLDPRRYFSVETRR